MKAANRQLLRSFCHPIHLFRKERSHRFSADRTPLGYLDDDLGENFSGRQFYDCDKIIPAEGIIMADYFSSRGGDDVFCLIVAFFCSLHVRDGHIGQFPQDNELWHNERDRYAGK